MDGIALVSIITSGVVGLGGGAATLWGPVITAREDRRTRRRDRLAEVYLDALRIVELESRWITAQARHWEIIANWGAGVTPLAVERPDGLEQSVVTAKLSAFGSAHVRALYRAWRASVDAIEEEHSAVTWDRDQEGGHIDTNALLNELHPAEAAARGALADAVGEELAI